jgi:glucans biosynthesis protein C
LNKALIVLFLYSLILLPFFAWIYKNNIRDKLISGTSFLEKNLLVYLLVIPLMTTQLIFLYFLPINTIYEASKFISYLLFLFYGFVFITNDKILNNIHRIRLFSLIIGVTLFLAIIIWLMNGGEGRSNSLFYLYNTLMVFSWVFAILGYSKKFINRKIPFYKYLNNSSYPFYIFHFLPLTIFAYYFAKGGLNLWMKYLLIVFGTYISTFLIYEFVKRIPYFNFLFGIKRI